MPKPVLRFGNFLAPNLLPVYTAVAEYIGRRVGCAVEIKNAVSYEQVRNSFDVCFICGLAYVEIAEGSNSPIEAIAAPVVSGRRYSGKPIYYSDVIVRRDSMYSSFADLRGCSWCFNEPYSQSGYGITRYWLVQMGEDASYFSQVIQSGWHDRSIQLVCAGKSDASAIDSHLLAITLRERPELHKQLRVVASLGPSTIQPVTVAKQLPSSLKSNIQRAIVQMADDPAAKQQLQRGLIDRFVAVTDDDYNDLRSMRDACEMANCLVANAQVDQLAKIH